MFTYDYYSKAIRVMRENVLNKQVGLKLNPENNRQ